MDEDWIVRGRQSILSSILQGFKGSACQITLLRGSSVGTLWYRSSWDIGKCASYRIYLSQKADPFGLFNNFPGIPGGYDAKLRFVPYVANSDILDNYWREKCVKYNLFGNFGVGNK